MKKSWILAFFVVVSLAFFVSVAHAEIAGQGLTISPPISEPDIKPGTSVDETITITNPTNQLLEVYPKAMDFKASGESGQPAFYGGDNSTSRFSLASWITFNPAKIALTQDQVVKFTYTITVPADAEPGGHYGAVFFANDPKVNPATGAQVSVGSMIGSLILVRVPGDIAEKAVLADFSTDQQYYFLGGKANITTRVANQGNVHFQPTGTIKVKDWAGKTVKELTFNDINGNVLPDSTRKFQNSWDIPGSAFGKYTASLSLRYGENGQQLTGQLVFWVLPWYLIVSGLVILLLIVILIIFLIKKLRHRKPKKPKEPPRPERLGPPPTEVMPKTPDGRIVLR